MTQINKIRNERKVTTDTTLMQKIRKYKQLHVNKLNNLDKIDKFLETYNSFKTESGKNQKTCTD